MFCQKCGTQNSDDDKFCSKCGNDLKSTVKVEKKGIMSKLGQMGIPGFRSGKTWKMTIATFVYVMFILAIIYGSSNKPSSDGEASINTPQISTPISTKIPTPIPTPIPTIKSDEKITIKFSSKMTNNIGEYSQASPGKRFLIVTMTIDNKGYESINTNPNYFNVVVDKIKYDYTSETYSLTDKLDTIDILNGGTITGSIAFLVPTGTTQYKFSYDQPFSNYNIEYIPNNPI